MHAICFFMLFVVEIKVHWLDIMLSSFFVSMNIDMFNCKYVLQI